MPLPFLNHFGLTETEVNVYELLLKLGESPAWKIVSESRLKRPTVYKALYSLEEKGLVLKNTKAKVIRFTPAPPTELLSLADEHTQNLTQAKQNLQSIMPSLLSSYTMAVEKPIVRTFEGVSGLKQIYEDTLSEGKEISAILQTAEVDPALEKWLKTNYVKKRAKAKIHTNIIVSSGKGVSEFRSLDAQEERTTKMVSSTLYPFQHEVDIYGNKIAFIHFKKGEPLIGVVITHPGIARTMKAWFDLAWNGIATENTIPNQI